MAGVCFFGNLRRDIFELFRPMSLKLCASKMCAVRQCTTTYLGPTICGLFPPRKRKKFCAKYPKYRKWV